MQKVSTTLLYQTSDDCFTREIIKDLYGSRNTYDQCTSVTEKKSTGNRYKKTEAKVET